VEDKTGMSVVRMLTLNLWGKNGVWKERRTVLIDGLRGLRPDLIAFQEAIVGDCHDQVCVLYPVCVDTSSRKSRF
jgi:hypothetical protein